MRLFRFSNQLAQPLSAPFEQVEAFYDAYRHLGQIIDSGRYRATFKSADGDLLTVHSHRVLHGRLPYDPASGARHLQDVYMEFDDLMARRRVLRGDHKPPHPGRGPLDAQSPARRTVGDGLGHAAPARGSGHCSCVPRVRRVRRFVQYCAEQVTYSPYGPVLRASVVTICT